MSANGAMQKNRFLAGTRGQLLGQYMIRLQADAADEPVKSLHAVKH